MQKTIQITDADNAFFKNVKQEQKLLNSKILLVRNVKASAEIPWEALERKICFSSVLDEKFDHSVAEAHVQIHGHCAFELVCIPLWFYVCFFEIRLGKGYVRYLFVKNNLPFLLQEWK